MKKRKTILKPPTPMDLYNENLQPIKGKGKGESLEADDGLVDSENEAEFQVDFNRIDTNACKKRSKAKARKERVERAKESATKPK